jgi:hypothetical protein
MQATYLLDTSLLTILLSGILIVPVHAQELPSSCVVACSDDYQACRKHADGQAMLEGSMMPYQGSSNPAPNINQLDAQRGFQGEVQKRRMDNQLQCEARKNRCASACAAPNLEPKKSVIFK